MTGSYHAPNRPNRWLTGVGGRVLAGLGLLGTLAWCQVQVVAQDSTTKRTTAKSSQATIDEAKLLQKLEQVLENEQALLKKFDALQEEVRVIRVRAASRGSSTELAP